MATETKTAPKNINQFKAQALENLNFKSRSEFGYEFQSEEVQATKPLNLGEVEVSLASNIDYSKATTAAQEDYNSQRDVLLVDLALNKATSGKRFDAGAGRNETMLKTRLSNGGELTSKERLGLLNDLKSKGKGSLFPDEIKQHFGDLNEKGEYEGKTKDFLVIRAGLQTNEAGQYSVPDGKGNFEFVTDGKVKDHYIELGNLQKMMAAGLVSNLTLLPGVAESPKFAPIVQQIKSQLEVTGEAFGLSVDELNMLPQVKVNEQQIEDRIAINQLRDDLRALRSEHPADITVHKGHLTEILNQLATSYATLENDGLGEGEAQFKDSFITLSQANNISFKDAEGNDLQPEEIQNLTIKQLLDNAMAQVSKMKLGALKNLNGSLDGLYAGDANFEDITTKLEKSNQQHDAALDALFEKTNNKAAVNLLEKYKESGGNLNVVFNPILNSANIKGQVEKFNEKYDGKNRRRRKPIIKPETAGLQEEELEAIRLKLENIYEPIAEKAANKFTKAEMHMEAAALIEQLKQAYGKNTSPSMLAHIEQITELFDVDKSNINKTNPEKTNSTKISKHLDALEKFNNSIMKEIVEEKAALGKERVATFYASLVHAKESMAAIELAETASRNPEKAAEKAAAQAAKEARAAAAMADQKVAGIEIRKARGKEQFPDSEFIATEKVEHPNTKNIGNKVTGLPKEEVRKRYAYEKFRKEVASGKRPDVSEGVLRNIKTTLDKTPIDATMNIEDALDEIIKEAVELGRKNTAARDKVEKLYEDGKPQEAKEKHDTTLEKEDRAYAAKMLKENTKLGPNSIIANKTKGVGANHIG